MNLREKLGELPTMDWDIKAQERAAIQALRENIDACQRALGLAKRMQAMASAPGYLDMMKAIEEVEKHSTARLLKATDPYEMARLQGGVNAFRDIRRIMSDNDQRVKELDSQVEDLQNRLSSIIRPTENKE